MNNISLLSHRKEEPENGILYMVGTPIGNLNDISQRALNILQNVSLVACEDTRQTKKIMNKFNISNKLISSLDILNLFIIFFVCLVSSQATKETFCRIFNALWEISFKFPIGVPTIYKIPFSGSSSLWDNKELLFI